MHDVAFRTLPFIDSANAVWILPLLILAITWTIILKGYALWFSARASQKGWFIALLVVNTLGILEIIYLVWFRPALGAPEAQEASRPHAAT